MLISNLLPIAFAAITVFVNYTQSTPAPAPAPQNRNPISVASDGIPNDAIEDQVHDVLYYEFNDANINISGASEFYNNWTENRRTKSPAEATADEWKSFAEEFFQDKNFDCGPNMEGGCRNLPSRKSIKQRLNNATGGRGLQRQVYFVGQFFDIIHYHDRQFEVPDLQKKFKKSVKM